MAPSAPLRLNTHLWNPLGERRALLLHGLGSDGGCWWRLASELADAGWLVLAPDLRSHGMSPTAANHTIAAFAADVALLGDRWDLIVGHSLGGAVAAQLLTEPDRAAAAVLVDPVLRLDDADREAVRAAQRRDVGELDAAAVAAAHPRWDARDVWRKVLAARRVTPDVVDAVVDHNDPWDLTGHAASWRGRVHLLVADPAHGGLLDPTLAATLAQAPDVTTETVARAGHSIHRDRPDVVADAVERITAHN
ncbi:alpha/beta fold hydrolase [Egicoccus sp. AB-alg6-2]|uniref:alpha/beta fold hydrolase n=1 Tax=Egicoccus sp. AB-alg6-2 TaxID=3242692 RepID=UPI00359D401B